MKSIVSRCSLPLAASLLLPLAAHGQLFRAYLASYGVDTNSCMVTAPCRLLPAALAAVHDAGEIWMLDSANYNSGTVTIGKNVTILAIPGQMGSIVAVAGGPAIVIAPAMNVTLRNVVIANNSSSPGTDGIRVTTGTLAIEGSVIAVAAPAFAVQVIGQAHVGLHDSVVRGSEYGVYATSGAFVDISRSRFFGCVFCVYVDAAGTSTTTVNVFGSAFSDYGAGAVVQGNAVGAVAMLVIRSSSFSNGQIGVDSGGSAPGGTVRIADTQATGNMTYGFHQQGSGVFESLGNNLVRGNAQETVGTVTVVPGT